MQNHVYKRQNKILEKTEQQIDRRIICAAREKARMRARQPHKSEIINQMK